MDELIRRLQQRLRHTPAVEMEAHFVRSNAAGEVIPPPPPGPSIPMAIVQDVERNLGFPLPALVRRLYTEVADGRYGPSYGILRLRSPEGTDITRWWEQPMSVEAWTQLHRRETEEDVVRHRPSKSIRFCEEGCNISYWLDCTTESARVFIDDPNRFGNDYLFETAAETLEQWLTDWLDKPWPTELYSTPKDANL